MGRNVQQILFCGSLDEGGMSKAKMPEKASEREEKLREHVRSTEFRPVEWEAVNSKWRECQRENQMGVYDGGRVVLLLFMACFCHWVLGKPSQDHM